MRCGKTVNDQQGCFESMKLIAVDVKPPLWSPFDEQEIEQAAKQAFTAYELATRRGHHPRLWQAVKGSAFHAHYVVNIGPGENPPGT
jgi:hypothetical protein